MNIKLIVRRLIFPIFGALLLASCGSDVFPSGDDAYCDEDWGTCYAFFENKIAMEKDNKWGYVDQEGEAVIDFEFDDAAAFAHGVAIVKIGTKENIINSKGETLITGGYDRIMRDVDEAIMLYKTSAGYGLLSESGDEITEDIYFDVVGQFVDGLLAVSVGAGDTYGYVNPSGDVVISTIYQEAYPFTSGLGLVKVGGRYGFVDQDGDFVIDATYLDAWSFDAFDRAIVQNLDETFSLINKQGVALIEEAADIYGEGPLYEVEDQTGDLYLYRADGTKFQPQMYTYINVYNEYLANVEWDEGLDSFDETILFNPDGTINQSVPYANSNYIVSGDKKTYLIDDSNQLQLYSYDLDFMVNGDGVHMISDTLVVVEDGEKVGAYTLEANPEIAIPFIYDNLLPMADDYIFAEQDGFMGVLTNDGDIIVPFEYDMFNFLPNI